MATGYCTLSPNVTDILLDKVHFSSSIHALSPDSKNVGDISLALSAITMNSAYYGYKRRFELVFDNPANLLEYKVKQEQNTEGAKSMIHIYTGHTNHTEVIPGIMTINTTGWSGAAAVPTATKKDFIIIITDSHMSNDMAERLINNIEADVDQELRKAAIITTNEGTIPTDLYYVAHATTVPRQIRTAVSYLAAYGIINDLFKASRSIIVSSTGKEEGVSDEDMMLAYQWLKRGTTALKNFISTYNARGGSGPQWSAVQPMVTGVGVYGQLHGVLSQEDNGDYSLPDPDVDPITGIELKLRP